jgi:ABC transporter C-terminal domain
LHYPILQSSRPIVFSWTRYQTTWIRNGEYNVCSWLFCQVLSNFIWRGCPDVDSVEALSEALSTWGVDDGAVVVISHDRAFCEKVGFTHVGTVVDGKFKLEERSMRSDDWQVVITTMGDTGSDKTEQTVEMGSTLRKKLFNAPKRIAKLEQLVGKAEEEISATEEEMLATGTDVGSLVALTKKKEKLEAQIVGHMKEWEELESFLAQAH